MTKAEKVVPIEEKKPEPPKDVNERQDLIESLEHVLKVVKKHVFYGENNDRGCKLEFPDAEKILAKAKEQA